MKRSHGRNTPKSAIGTCRTCHRNERKEILEQKRDDIPYLHNKNKTEKRGRVKWYVPALCY